MLPAASEREYALVMSEGKSHMAFDDCIMGVHEDIDGDNEFDVVYNTILWLLENGYIKKGETK